MLEVPVEIDNDGSYRITINITNFHKRKAVPNGSWKLVPTYGGVAVGPGATFPLNRFEELEPASRSYLYNKNLSAYVVKFDVTEDDVRPEFLVRCYAFGRGAGKKTRNPLRKLQQKVTGHDTRVKLANNLYRVARAVRPPNGKRILFASEARTAIGGNLLQVRDRMVERGLDQEYEFRYSFRIPQTATKLGTARTIWLIATSDYVLIDDYFSMLLGLKLDPRTVLVQLWHAGSGFKTIGFSRFGRYGSPKLTNSHRTYTYAICGSTHLTGVYAEAFGIEENAVIPTGLPRIDVFLDPERTARVKAEFASRYPGFVGKRVILFAPTFRGRGIKDGYYDYDRLDLGAIHEAMGDDSVFLFRMHHFIHQAPPIPAQYADRLFNVGDYPDTNDLLHSVDVLITDYSSIIYEFSLLNRPMVFFAYDQEIYSVTRGFHRDYALTAPGKIVADSAGLVRALVENDFDTWKVAGFRRENFDHVDTHSSDRVIDWLILGRPQERQLETAADPHTSVDQASGEISPDAIVSERTP
ncbi:hypothetical protein EFY87_01870 [Flexivirga caeni]|uniref:CDP-ribitol ribitolphosphotransferase n=2 Tax=Flexivirga caeni TaxID=2294115 RepID=A0A3M9MIY1_9MICO|nr:hypothetical protein EFY87_01870 [Flexivirga caeni]